MNFVGTAEQGFRQAPQTRRKHLKPTTTQFRPGRYIFPSEASLWKRTTRHGTPAAASCRRVCNVSKRREDWGLRCRDPASFAVWSRRASRYTHRKSLRSKSLKTHSAHSLWEILWNLSFNPSLLWCHLKTTNISAMFENRKHFFFLFRTGMWKDYH